MEILLPNLNSFAMHHTNMKELSMPELTKTKIQM